MKVFVGFGFRHRDRWVREMVFPLIEAFGHQVLDGSELQGEIISDGVQAKIQEADSLFGFLTRRDPDPADANRWTTHPWVRDEIVYGLGQGKKLVEVRETGVVVPDGIVGDRQYIPYDENQRDVCLVALAKLIGTWPRGKARIFLRSRRPEDIEELAARLKQPGFRCAYQFVTEDGGDGPEIETRIRKDIGGLYISVSEIPPESLISVNVQHAGTDWSSFPEATDSLSVTLIKSPRP